MTIPTIRPALKRCTATALAVTIGFALAGQSAHAQSVDPAQESTLIKLIRGLVDSGALDAQAGQALIAEASREAQAAHSAQAAPQVQTQPGDVRVPYIPQTVRDGIRDEVRAEVLAQAERERWAAPDAVPAWSQRIRVEGDVRVRNESRLFSETNSTIETDWSAINDGPGYDINVPNTNLSPPPLRNTTRDRTNSWRIRARFGVIADLGERTTAGVRIATGNDDGPVSATQTLGGGLNKKDAWLDQAWLSWRPTEWLDIVGGRFDNPYWSTDTLFSNDLNFDGLAFKYDDGTAGDLGLSWFGTLGLTPLEYSSDSFPGNSQEKMESKDKWLNGLQVGAGWRFSDDHAMRAALAYYDFRNIAGRVSEPCALYMGDEHCSTDWSRPAFMQKGNTLMLLRDIALDPIDPANTPLPQYVGLASEFRVLDANLRWDLPAMNGYGLRLEANWLKNTAYDRTRMWQRAHGGIVNNLAFREDDEALGPQDILGGDTAYMGQATFGVLGLRDRGDWNAWLGYKRIDPDALPDGYNDSNFHLGGTNAKGYYLGASWMFDRNVWMTGRWMAAKEVVGAPLSIDVFQLEVNASF